MDEYFSGRASCLTDLMLLVNLQHWKRNSLCREGDNIEVYPLLFGTSSVPQTEPMGSSPLVPWILFK